MKPMNIFDLHCDTLMPVYIRVIFPRPRKIAIKMHHLPNCGEAILIHIALGWEEVAHKTGIVPIGSEVNLGVGSHRTERNRAGAFQLQRYGKRKRVIQGIRKIHQRLHARPRYIMVGKSSVKTVITIAKMDAKLFLNSP